MMDLIDIKSEEQEQCGSIYLTSSGALIIHCTLCEKKYEGFDDYASHIAHRHIAPDFFPREDEFLNYDDSENDFSQNFDFEDIEKLEDDGSVIHERKDMIGIKLETSSSPEYLLDSEDDSKDDNFLEVEKLDSEGFEENRFKNVSNVNVKIETTQDSDEHEVHFMRPLHRKSNLKRQERTHKCPHCDFSCNDRSNLLGHIKRHSSNKPHKCIDCAKRFYTRTELKAHMRSHTGERPYLCNECGKAFGTSSKLSLHRKRHANLRDKECPMCDMKFYSSTRLRDHMSIHSDDRPLKCDICDATFKSYSCLKNHRKLHENQRQYKCPLCPSSFNQNPGLYSHLKKKHSVVKSSEATEKELQVEHEEL